MLGKHVIYEHFSITVLLWLEVCEMEEYPSVKLFEDALYGCAISLHNIIIMHVYFAGEVWW